MATNYTKFNLSNSKSLSCPSCYNEGIHKLIKIYVEDEEVLLELSCSSCSNLFYQLINRGINNNTPEEPRSKEAISYLS